MSELQFSAIADKLCRYFERVNSEHPGEHWRNGFEMCRRWQALLVGQPTQTDIDEFVTHLAAEPNPGSGWVEIEIQFRHWARKHGFRAPG